MITVKDNVFRLDTKNTTYIFRIMPYGYLQNLYYGAKINDVDDYSVMTEKQGHGQGTAIALDEKENRFFPDNTCLEFSSVCRGDFRESMVIIADEQDNTVADYKYEGYELLQDFVIPNLPNSRGKEQTLAIKTSDTARKIRVTLYYSTLTDCDVIVKSVSVENYGDCEARILRVMSNQLDLADDAYILDTLDGSWGRERQLSSGELHCGITKIDSKRGVSSNVHNPYVVIRKKDSNRFYGDAYGFNLVYSGNHAEIFDKTPLNKVRVLNGINDNGFCWHLKPRETFYAPEATLCYSDRGTNVLTQRYHKFINEHIIPEHWAYRERPVLVNNWEATYFNFTEKKLLEIAKTAKNLGVELFVLDDGWFGNRTDDTKGLGDWTENKKRLPNGLNGLSKKINAMGLQFGVWVEPEMVNPNSDLYRKHPEWAVKHPNYEPMLCRNQLLLDLSNDAVCEYIIDCMSKVFSSANISYVKWDFNRPLTDAYSPTLCNRQGEFYHRFTLGFYKIMNALTKQFPDILFEGCASGGNRFDLGALCYTPQIWASDNTDSFDRVKIHEGTLYGYPASCIGSHVSASPNHQTLRVSTIDNRFNTSCIGAFGYELDLSELNKTDCEAIKRQLTWYKKHRKTLQFGEYHQLLSVFSDNNSCWALVSPDKSQAVVNYANTIQQTIPKQAVIKVNGLDPKYKYRVATRRQPTNVKVFGGLINQISPVHLNENSKLVDVLAKFYPLDGEQETYTATGDILEKCGIKLYQEWASTGFDGNTRIMHDFGSRLYSIDKIDENTTIK